MAIAKMQKLSLVSKPEFKDELIRTLQDLQNVEVGQLPAEEEADADQPKTGTHSKAYASYIDLYHRAERALVELSRYGKDLPFWQKLTAQRPTYSMDKLHQEVDHDKAIQQIETIERLREKRHDIQDKRAHIEEEQSRVANWRGLAASPDELYHMKHFDVALGVIPNDQNNTTWRELKEACGKDLALTEIYSNDDEIGLVAVAKPGKLEDVMSTLSRHHFQEWPYPYEERPDQVFKDLEEKRKGLIRAEEETVEELKSSNQYRDSIRLAAEEFYGQAQRALAQELTYENDYLLYLTGWCDVEDTDEVISRLDQQIGEHHYALKKEEISEEEIEQDEVPIKLKNNALNRPFETVVRMYGMPNYREIDPTPFITWFYMIFFAMMLGDFGYGLILWLMTLFAKKKMDLTGQGKELVDLAYVVSYPSMIVGLLYGSFFGESIPTGVISPTEDAIVLMGLSVGIGVVHLVVALMIKSYLEAKRGNIDSFWSDGFGWIVTLLGLIAWIGGVALKIGVMATIGKWATIIGFAGMIIFPLIFQKKKGVALVLGLYNIYGVSGYIGDLVSYTRLMALGIAGGSIAMAFNMLVGFFPTPIRFTIGLILIVALQGFNFFLSALSAYVHGLRLIFVEFFGKFFESGGREFKPIDTLQKYVRLMNQEK